MPMDSPVKSRTDVRFFFNIAGSILLSSLKVCHKRVSEKVTVNPGNSINRASMRLKLEFDSLVPCVRKALKTERFRAFLLPTVTWFGTTYLRDLQPLFVTSVPDFVSDFGCDRV